MLTYEKFVSGNSGSQYKYGENVSIRHSIMAAMESIGVYIFYILLMLPKVSAGHDCTPEATKYYLEEKMGRDVSWVRHDGEGTCSVLFSDSVG